MGNPLDLVVAVGVDDRPLLPDAKVDAAAGSRVGGAGVEVGLDLAQRPAVGEPAGPKLCAIRPGCSAVIGWMSKRKPRATQPSGMANRCWAPISAAYRGLSGSAGRHDSSRLAVPASLHLPRAERRAAAVSATRDLDQLTVLRRLRAAAGDVQFFEGRQA
jgi:hypothetical protein